MPKAIVRKKVGVVVVFVAVGLFVSFFLLPGGLVITGLATYLERCFPV